MSRASIPDEQRLIAALDIPSGAEARDLVRELGDSVSFYKVGLELFTAADGFAVVDWLSGQGKQVFVDLKFFDVPATVARAVKQLQVRNITFATVHGNDAIMRAAAEASGDVGILAVTVLTSLDSADMRDLGFDCDIAALVRSRASRALALGCAGVVASGQEAAVLRNTLGERGVIVTPGIRPGQHDDDQKRTVTPTQALRDGADYLVVGRPIRDADSPKAAADEIQAEIRSALAP
ncbi:MAG TPA: orotidine-5'-phosphate decarboxylase [Gammaproteobacteria bacterium]|jgi:orotidine-5'-phosphate decarboxylase|nr:orotidine-5'-phosphate decarboxylase [Acidiferrobacteraceae bacterium]MDP6397938.1 orotidine-5'-phosphate decarboxylase [Arenicellales bacterium]HCX86463.1 orotidine-5'-phosphate decarboxylase [Gammaproteobacteria bacterium]MDP6550836.1 orotidine-5'-phosphate decarboxylase [Arenicellales bacterium]MDP6790788.1 orotidine-5'-phosphate decarboxylase [Arenicellales bacterium]|tara:strand:+ start:2045 stop:2752 length:708 start_codon:yes stop_codon:yes gene_type:complete